MRKQFRMDIEVIVRDFDIKGILDKGIIIECNNHHTMNLKVKIFYIH